MGFERRDIGDMYIKLRQEDAVSPAEAQDQVTAFVNANSANLSFALGGDALETIVNIAERKLESPSRNVSRAASAEQTATPAETKNSIDTVQSQFHRFLDPRAISNGVDGVNGRIRGVTDSGKIIIKGINPDDPEDLTNSPHFLYDPATQQAVRIDVGKGERLDRGRRMHDYGDLDIRGNVKAVEEFRGLSDPRMQSVLDDADALYQSFTFVMGPSAAVLDASPEPEVRVVEPTLEPVTAEPDAPAGDSDGADPGERVIEDEAQPDPVTVKPQVTPVSSDIDPIFQFQEIDPLTQRPQDPQTQLLNCFSRLVQEIGEDTPGATDTISKEAFVDAFMAEIEEASGGKLNNDDGWTRDAVASRFDQLDVDGNGEISTELYADIMSKGFGADVGAQPELESELYYASFDVLQYTLSKTGVETNEQLDAMRENRQLLENLGWDINPEHKFDDSGRLVDMSVQPAIEIDDLDASEASNVLATGTGEGERVLASADVAVEKLFGDNVSTTSMASSPDANLAGAVGVDPLITLDSNGQPIQPTAQPVDIQPAVYNDPSTDPNNRAENTIHFA